MRAWPPPLICQSVTFKSKFWVKICGVHNVSIEPMVFKAFKFDIILNELEQYFEQKYLECEDIMMK